MIISIQDDILILHNHGLLKRLLEDKTTKKNIMWATDAYNDCGAPYYRNEEIKPELITGKNSDIIKTRARKELEKQFERTRQRAEVFTPFWICKRMNDDAERFWFEDNAPAAESDNNADYIGQVLRDDKLFKKYIDSKRLEITCGEAPYLISRYDVATGEMIPVEKRIGILDRKLQAIGRYVKDEKEWLKLVTRAYQATFGYEFQGDNVLIARVNLLMSLGEYMENRWGRKPTDKEYEKIANIVAWNIWQMDGLTYTIPFSKTEEHMVQLDIFGLLQDEEESDPQGNEEKISTQPYCRIYDWHNKKKSVDFQELRKGMHMKFDFIIGNPPYNEEAENTSDKPIYDKFMDNCFEISDKVCLISPARFLFNTGKTPKAWNEKMLSDEHFKVLMYEPDSFKIFPGKSLPGGIAITYRDANKDFGAIEVFSPFIELRSLSNKIREYVQTESITDIMKLQNRFNLEELYKDHPELKELISSEGRERRIVTSAFNKLPIFTDVDPAKVDEVAVLGLEGSGNRRTYKQLNSRYIADNGNLWKWKVLVSKSNGASGTLREEAARITTVPFVEKPGVGYTQSFIGVGSFDSENEAFSAEKYLKTKFARCLLGILKNTQDNPPDRWKYVPLQDFSYSSDIDWSQSISNIDCQLYAKYGLDQNEIDFIESHVKEMK